MLVVLLSTTCLVLVVLSIIQQCKIQTLRHDKWAFHSLAENSPDLIFRYNRQDRRVYVNPAVARLFFGKPKEDIVGQSPADSPFLDYGQSRTLIDGILYVFETDETGGIELFFTDEEGQTRSQKMLLIPEGVDSMLDLSRDISAIREAERTVSDLVAHLPGFVCKFHMSADGNMNYPFASPRIEEFFGLRPEDITGNAAPLHVMTHPEDANRVLRAIVKSARTLSSLHVEYRLLRPGYPERWMEVIANPEPEADGGVLWSGIFLDITKRKHIEEELADSQNFLDHIIDAIADPVFVKDRQHRWIHFNEAFCRLLGGTREELIGKSDFEFFPEDEARAFWEGDELVFSDGKGFSREEEITTKWGGKRCIFTRKTSFYDMHGRPNITAVITDITERKSMELQLAARERELRTLLENIPDNIARYTPDARHLYLNSETEHTTGKPNECLQGRTPMECFPDGRYAEIERRVIATAASGSYNEMEREWRVANGETEYHLIRFVPEHDEKGAIVSVLAIGTDITERKHAEEKLRLAASVFTNTNEGIVVTDADNRILDVNAAFTRITGYTREEVIGKNPNLLKSQRQAPEFYVGLWQTLEQTGHWVGELWNRRKNGELYAEMLTVSVVKDEQGKLSHYVGVFSDITLIKEHEQRLKRIAHYDTLTDLPNRLLFMDRLKQAVAQAQRTGDLFAVCYSDLDGFKSVNDCYGHEAGDNVLAMIGRRMQECVRAVDTVGRIGGDEFVILLLNLESVQECEMILERLLDTVAQPIRLSGRSVSCTASLGVALFQQNDDDPDTLLRHADHAMYLAKRSGKSIYRFFDPDQLNPEIEL